jgi:transposase-like protein
MARPSKYKPEFAEQAAKLCLLGATDAQLADFFEVSVSTINLWKVQHSEFSESIRVPKGLADERVEQSLFRRAMGYEHDEVDIKVVDKEIIQTPIRKYYPPDTTAMIFWLKNRQPEQWRETKAVELTGAGGGPVVIQATAADERI